MKQKMKRIIVLHVDFRQSYNGDIGIIIFNSIRGINYVKSR